MDIFDTSQFQQASFLNKADDPDSFQPRGTAWQSMLPASLRNRCLEIIHLIAERLSSPERVMTIVEQAKQQSDRFHWTGPSLVTGSGSLALLFLYLARSFPEQRWKELSHLYLRLAARDTQEYPFLYPGLWGGSSGFALLLSAFCQDEPRYQNMFDRICTSVVEQIIEAETHWSLETRGVPNVEYDAVTGAAGMLAFLIALPSPTPMVHDAIEKLLKYLVWLADKDEDGHEHWFTPPEYFPVQGNYHEQYPNGYFNLGLSHGVPGPLAALSLAWQADYRVSGQREAIELNSRWIIEHQLHDQWGINWPSGVSLEASYSFQQWSKLPPSRAAWCYGAPGIASSLWLAGQALENRDLKHIAMEGIEAVLRRPVEIRSIDSPTICHGIGGLLAICLRFSQGSNSQATQATQTIREHIPLLVSQILDTCNPAFPLGVRDEEIPGKFVDDPGFLTGAAGVALVLLAAATPVEPQWDRLLLIS